MKRGCAPAGASPLDPQPVDEAGQRGRDQDDQPTDQRQPHALRGGELNSACLADDGQARRQHVHADRRVGQGRMQRVAR